MLPYNQIVIGTWLVFWLYWLISAFSAKKNIVAGDRRFASLRIVIFILTILLLHFVASQEALALHSNFYAKYEAIHIFGLVLFYLGILFAIWARLYLGKNWGMPMSQKLNPDLVTTGPYQYVRHPIYSGLLIAILGAGIADSVLWLVALVIVIVYFAYSATQEEKLLETQFPKLYPEYKRHTKMLIPFVF